MKLRAACALVLAGGRSARFGSDKALAIFAGQALVTRAVEAAQAAFTQVAVVAKDPVRYAAQARGAALVADGSDLVTPLAGLIAGLEWSPAEVVFVFAVDMPFAVDAALLDALEAAIEGRDAAVPTCGGQPEPLCALFRKAPALQAGRALLAAQKGPSALLGALDAAWVDWPDGRPFLDADTPDALADLGRR